MYRIQETIQSLEVCGYILFIVAVFIVVAFVGVLFVLVFLAVIVLKIIIIIIIISSRSRIGQEILHCSTFRIQGMSKSINTNTCLGVGIVGILVYKMGLAL